MYPGFFAEQSESVFYYPMHQDTGIDLFAVVEYQLNSSAQASNVFNYLVAFLSLPAGVTFAQLTYASVNVTLLTDYPSIMPGVAAMFNAGNYCCLLAIQWQLGFHPFAHRVQVQLAELLVDSVV